MEGIQGFVELFREIQESNEKLGKPILSRLDIEHLLWFAGIRQVADMPPFKSRISLGQKIVHIDLRKDARLKAKVTEGYNHNKDDYGAINVTVTADMVPKKYGNKDLFHINDENRWVPNGMEAEDIGKVYKGGLSINWYQLTPYMGWNRLKVLLISIWIRDMAFYKPEDYYNKEIFTPHRPILNTESAIIVNMATDVGLYGDIEQGDLEDEQYEPPLAFDRSGTNIGVYVGRRNSKYYNISVETFVYLVRQLLEKGIVLW